MAIIKKLKRLGSTVRGATSAQATQFDRDGNIVSSGKYTSMIPARPGVADVGKVYTATGSGSAAWQNIPNELPVIAEGDAGKVLSVNTGETGVEWADISQVPAIEDSDTGKVLTATGSGAAWQPAIVDITSEFDFTDAVLQKDFFKAFKQGHMIWIQYRGTNAGESALLNPIAIAIPVSYHIGERQCVCASRGTTPIFGFVSSTSNMVLAYSSIPAAETIYISGWFYFE